MSTISTDQVDPAERTANSNHAVRLTHAALIAIGALACGFAWVNRFVQDDAFISFLYSRNLVEGAGLTWFGEHIEGYTSVLWVLLVAAGIKLGVDPVWWCWTLSILAFTAMLGLLSRLAWRVNGKHWQALTVVVLFAGNYSVSAYATSGMETMLQTALVCAVALLGLTEREARRPALADVGFSLLSALALLTRPDSAVLLAVPWLFRLRRLWGGDRRAIRLMALLIPVAAIMTAWLGWKWMYYGRLLPNTYYAKAGTILTLNPNGLVYLGRFLHWYLIWPFLVAGLVAAARQRKRPTRAMVGLGLTILCWAGYVVLVGGDFMEFRFVVPIVGFLFILLVQLVSDAGEMWFHKPRAAVAIMGTVLLLLSWVESQSFVDVTADRTLDSIHALGTCYELYPDQCWDRIGRPLGQKLAGTGAVLALNACGAIPYFSRLKTIDAWGLNDRVIPSQGNVAPATYRRPGHRRYAPLWYLRQRRVNLVLAHPTIVSRGLFHSEGASVFFRDWIRRSLSFNRESISTATVVGIPIDGTQCLLGWYLTPSAAVDRAMRQQAWERFQVDDGIGAATTAPSPDIPD